MFGCFLLKFEGFVAVGGFPQWCKESYSLRIFGGFVVEVFFLISGLMNGILSFRLGFS